MVHDALYMMLCSIPACVHMCRGSPAWNQYNARTCIDMCVARGKEMQAETRKQAEERRKNADLAAASAVLNFPVVQY